MSNQIREILRTHGRLPVDVEALDDEADLFQNGLTSHASVNIMLALESAYDLEFPDVMLKRSVFASISSIRAAVDDLLTEGAA